MRQEPSTTAPVDGAQALAVVTSADEGQPTASRPATGTGRRSGQPDSSRMLTSATHAMRALDIIASNPHGVPAKVVARRLGQSLSSTYYVLQTLSALGFVEPSPVSRGLYILGPKIADLFRGYVASWTLPHRLEPALVQVRDAAAARTYGAVWDGGDLEITCVRGRRGAAELHDVSAGFRGAAHTLAPGKVLLAALPTDAWPAYLRTPTYPRYTEHTLTTPADLRAELREVRANGYAVDVEEFRPNVCCVAAPVRVGTGRIVATIAVSVTARRFHRDLDELREVVCSAAVSISEQFQVLDPLGTLLGPAGRQPAPAEQPLRPTAGAPAAKSGLRALG